MILLQTDTGITSKNIPLLDEVGDGETVSNRRAIHFSRSDSHSTQGGTVSDLTLNGDLSPASTLASSTIGFQHTSEKRGS